MDLACTGGFLIAFLHTLLKGCDGTCSQDGSQSVATMCRDSVVSGRDVYIDTDLGHTLTLDDGVGCTCDVETQFAYRMDVFTRYGGTKGAICGTSVHVQSASQNLKFNCFSFIEQFPLEPHENLTVNFRREAEPYISEYCVRLILSHSCGDGYIMCDDQRTCIDPAERCDGTNQCPDGSDEASKYCDQNRIPDPDIVVNPLIKVTCKESRYLPDTTTSTTPTTTTTPPTTTTTAPSTTTTTKATTVTTTLAPTTASTTKETSTTATPTSTTKATTKPTTKPTTTSVKTTKSETPSTTETTVTSSTPTKPSTTTVIPSSSTTLEVTPTAATTTPTKETTEAPTEAPTQAPTDPPTEPPTKATTEPPTEPPTKATTEPPTEPPTSVSTLKTEATTESSSSATLDTTPPIQTTDTATETTEETPSTTPVVIPPTGSTGAADDDDDVKMIIVGVVTGVVGLILLIAFIVYWFRSSNWAKRKSEVKRERFRPERREPTHAWYPANKEVYTINDVVRDNDIHIQDVYDAEEDKYIPIYNKPRKKNEFILYSL